MLEQKHHVCDLESTETVRCSAKVESPFNKSISWYNGSTGVKIKSRGRLELNSLSLKINKIQLDDAGTYECRGESSTRFYTIYVNSEYSLFSYCSFTSALFWLHLTTDIMQCFLVLSCFAVDAILKWILPYNCVSKPYNDIINTDTTTNNNKYYNTNDVHLCNTAIECYILKQTK